MFGSSLSADLHINLTVYLLVSSVWFFVKTRVDLPFHWSDVVFIFYGIFLALVEQPKAKLGGR